MSAAGGLKLQLRVAEGKVAALQPGLLTPPASRLLAGQSAPDAIHRLRRLFSLCGHAQAAAGRAALVAAGADLPPLAGRPVLLEAAQEHLWRLLRDWPRKLGQPAQDQWFAEWYRRLSEAIRSNAGQLPELADFVEHQLLDSAWDRVSTPAQLLAWSESSASPLARLVWQLLASPFALELVQAMGETAPSHPGSWLEAESFSPPEHWPADFEGRPHLAQQPETGGLARHRDHPLLAALEMGRVNERLTARLLARVLDVRGVANRLARPGEDEVMSTLSPESGTGLAWLETARGVLLHRVKLAAGGVLEYAVVSPTAWNFHPNGPCAQALAPLVGRPVPDVAALRRVISPWVLALDPCVPWHLEVMP